LSRVLVITGASSGLGRALALRAAQSGDNLVLIARRESLLREVALECKNAVALVGSVADEPIWKAAVQAVRQLEGDEIILVNNAGIARFGSFHDQDFNTWREQMDTNLLGAMGLTHALIPAMLERGAGRVVNILSIVLKTALPGTAGYTASKAGLEAMSRALSAEYRKQGITFTNIYPGASNTSIWDAQQGHPPRDQMIPEDSLADTIHQALQTPRDRVIEELVITPPLGIL
jgi:3-oxoacyl-[acyl-carrier protein] reductase